MERLKRCRCGAKFFPIDGKPGWFKHEKARCLMSGQVIAEIQKTEQGFDDK